MTKDDAQQVVDDLDTARMYVPDELRASVVKASIHIAKEFGVISDDTELEFVEAGGE